MGSGTSANGDVFGVDANDFDAVGGIKPLDDVGFFTAWVVAGFSVDPIFYFYFANPSSIFSWILFVIC